MDRFSNISLVTLAALFLFVGFSGCEHAELPTNRGGSSAPDFDSLQANIFDQSCVQCHVGSNPPGDLNLEEGKAYDNLVDVPSSELPQYRRVAPNQPDSSYLVMKVEGSDKIIGQRMPAGGQQPLSQEQIDAIREWIAEGAPR